MTDDDHPPRMMAPPPAPLTAPPPAPPEVMGTVEPVKAAPAGELDVAAFQAKAYPPPRCWALVTDVYRTMFDADPTDVATITESMRLAARSFRLALHKRAGGMVQAEEPVDLAVVLMWPTSKRRSMHCGIYWRGSVLHATEDGNLYQDMHTLAAAYPVMEFWTR